jgi:hypothetical protein
VGRWRRRWQTAAADLTLTEEIEPDGLLEAIRDALRDRQRSGRPREVKPAVTRPAMQTVRPRPQQQRHNLVPGGWRHPFFRLSVPRGWIALLRR